MKTKCVDFPPVENTEKIKLQRFLKTTSEFMDVDFEIEEVTIIRVTVDADRPDVITMISKVASNEKRKQSNGGRRTRRADSTSESTEQEKKD